MILVSQPPASEKEMVCLGDWTQLAELRMCLILMRPISENTKKEKEKKSNPCF